jgi:hypothetical protein
MIVFSAMPAPSIAVIGLGNRAHLMIFLRER